jgi:hypothetical protein
MNRNMYVMIMQDFNKHYAKWRKTKLVSNLGFSGHTWLF